MRIKQLIASEIYRHFFLSILFNAVSGASKLLVVSILAHSIDKDRFAQYVIFLTLTNMVPLLVYPGFASIVNKGAMMNNSRFINRAIRMSVRLAWFITPLYLIGCAAFGALSHNTELTILAIIAAVFIPVSAWDRSDGIFMGNTEFRTLRWMRLINAILTLALVAAAVYLTQNVFFVAGAYTVARLATAVLAMNRANRFLQDESASDPEEVDVLVRQGVQFSLLSWFNVVVDNIDRFVLYGLGTEGLALFYTGSHVPVKLRENLKVSTVVPITSWLKQGDDVYRSKLRQFGLLLFGGLTLLSVSLAVAATWYIPLLFGEGYHGAIPIARIMSFLLMTHILHHFLAMRSIIHEDSIFYQRVTYFKQAIYLVLLVPVIHLYGAVGAASLLLGIGILNLTLNALHYWAIERRSTT